MQKDGKGIVNINMGESQKPSVRVHVFTHSLFDFHNNNKIDHIQGLTTHYAHLRLIVVIVNIFKVFRFNIGQKYSINENDILQR